MNRYAIFHRPESCYAYAVAADTLAVVLRTARGDRFDEVEILYNNKYDFTKRRQAKAMERCATDGLYAYYRAEITLPDARFAYIFRLVQKGKVYYFSEDGLAEEYRFDLAYYTFFQFPFINMCDVPQAVEWADGAVFYQIFVDRFARGDFEKDDAYINTAWDGKIDRYSFTGGDLDGIAQKIPYLKNSGFNALYLTPIFLSASNHKYNVRDYLTVDPQFGDGEKLAKLLKAAHGHGVRVIVDCVFNHCDCSHEFFKDVEEKGRQSKYYDWFLINGERPSAEKCNYACFADCTYMPKWNTGNAAVRRYLTDIALEYLKIGFDGLRLDVADEISHEMWRQLRREVKEKYPEALILGEIWHDNEHWLRGDQLDGVMNYKLQKLLVDYFARGTVNARTAADRMNAILMANTENANANSLSFLDNHDTPRFLRLAGGNKDRLLCALCAAVMFPNMPCVFYGTEIPLDGGGDPDCRQPFDWEFRNRTEEYAEKFRAVIGIRGRCRFKGARAAVTTEKGLLKMVRQTDGGSVTAYFNMTGAAKKLGVDGNIVFALNFKDGKILNDGAVVFENIKN